MPPTLHHVGVTVSDLDRSVAFYRDVLGCAVLDRFDGGGEAFETAVGVPGATAAFAHLDGGDGRIELVEYDPEGEPTGRGALNDPGEHHVGLAVDDIHAASEELPDHVETVSEPRTTGSGTTIVFLRDPDGNLVELLDP